MRTVVAVIAIALASCCLFGAVNEAIHLRALLPLNITSAMCCPIVLVFWCVLATALMQLASSVWKTK